MMRRFDFDPAGMPDADRQRIRMAEDSGDWWRATELQNEAETPRARNILHIIATSLYHRDEGGLI